MGNRFELRSVDILLVCKILFIIFATILFGSALSEYRGESYVYLIFSITSNGLLYFGFRKRAIFFDTFIGVFLWLGFWLKLTVRVAFADSQFHESVGNFGGTGEAFDSALLATSVAFSGLMVASYIREKFIFAYPADAVGVTQPGLHQFYKNYRTVVLLGFAILILSVAATNVYFGFYQRGSLTRTVLPFGLNGVYKWLILFGLASISAVIVKFEYFDNQKKSYTVAFLALFETFTSNVSLLSRGMILNSGALVYGFYRSSFLNRIKIGFRFPIVCFVFFVVLFVSSIVAVNAVRTISFYSNSNPSDIDEKTITRTAAETKLLFLDRWVGIEGVMAVSSYPAKNWDLWWTALQEQYSENRLSFYDANLIAKDSPYKNTDQAIHHFISLPGLVAFSFYPGSHFFLFVSLFAASMFAFLVELFVYKFAGRNLVLCALIAQVMAFRYASFGYVPAQSYLLFGSVFLNVIIIYLADKLLALWFQRKQNI